MFHVLSIKNTRPTESTETHESFMVASGGCGQCGREGERSDSGRSFILVCSKEPCSKNTPHCTPDIEHRHLLFWSFTRHQHPHVYCHARARTELSQLVCASWSVSPSENNSKCYCNEQKGGKTTRKKSRRVSNWSRSANAKSLLRISWTAFHGMNMLRLN